MYRLMLGFQLAPITSTDRQGRQVRYGYVASSKKRTPKTLPRCRAPHIDTGLRILFEINSPVALMRESETTLFSSV